MHEQGYAELAFEILSLYIDDIPAADLRALCAKTYTAEVFGTARSCRCATLETACGWKPCPTAPRWPSRTWPCSCWATCSSTNWRAGAKQLNILGATSGDTGSAAEYAMRGKQGVRVFMTSPHGRMSPFQQAQMFSLQDENIHNIAIEGVFDDCQDIVKAVSNDLAFKRQVQDRHRQLHQLGAAAGAGGVLLCRLFSGHRSNDQKVSFTVPSGNFGNVCAGHVARMMGLPIDKLVVATNENDVLDEFFRTGVYRVRGSADTHETSSPSMDISKASNFERFVFDLLGRDGVRAPRRCSAMRAGRRAVLT
jgi:threonine synthase